MSVDMEAIVQSVIAASDDISDTLTDLAPHHRREVDRIVARSRVTPDAALAVLRGRQQRQRALAAQSAAADAIVEAIR